MIYSVYLVTSLSISHRKALIAKVVGQDLFPEEAEGPIASLLNNEWKAHWLQQTADGTEMTPQEAMSTQKPQQQEKQEITTDDIDAWLNRMLSNTELKQERPKETVAALSEILARRMA